MFKLLSTYRIQFHSGFTFSEMKRILPYLKTIGIKTIYASPIFQAVPGSTHGYDSINPNVINPEIGTQDELEALLQDVKAAGMYWLQDIVPNHMAFHVANPWIADVLRHGKHSGFAQYFDIDWAQGKLLYPVLGEDIATAIKEHKLKLTDNNSGIALQYGDTVLPLNSQPATSNVSPDELREIVNAQHYELCSWQETNHRINYRRFFLINGLICTNIQDKHVFVHFHKGIKDLVNKQYLQGVRIDHIDGLSHPGEYLQRLRNMVGDDINIQVEKILAKDEEIPQDWPIQGTTGYDFLMLVNNLFTYANHSERLGDIYKQFSKSNVSLHEEERAKKLAILNKHMGGEMETLYKLFLEIVPSHRKINAQQLKEVIAEILVGMPVYRFYGNSIPLPEYDRNSFKKVLLNIAERRPSMTPIVEGFIKTLTQPDGNIDKAKTLIFYKRMMQYACVVMAKGVEDTLMYTHNLFIAHNEVGDNPANMGIPVDKFHQAMKTRQDKWPTTLNTTSTHDTKRGEDTRARLNVLSEVVEEWATVVDKWHKQTRSFHEMLPATNDIYFIFQVIVGSYPLNGTHDERYLHRLQEYLIKALREGKVNSDWATPNRAYEEKAERFAAWLLDTSGKFHLSLVKFLDKISDYGIVNSLAQVALKVTSPGVPDIYQGTELWDYSFADPDNRREVNYTSHMKLSDEIMKMSVKNIWATRQNGGIKMYITQQLLQARKENPSLFTDGDYIPLEVKGVYKEHILAFARVTNNSCCVVIIPLHIATLSTKQQIIADNIDWKDTCVKSLYEDGLWNNVITQEKLIIKAATINVKEVFNTLPIAVLMYEKAR